MSDVKIRAIGKSFPIGGQLVPVGSVVSVDECIARAMVHAGRAEYVPEVSRVDDVSFALTRRGTIQVIP